MDTNGQIPLKECTGCKCKWQTQAQRHGQGGRHSGTGLYRCLDTRARPCYVRGTVILVAFLWLVAPSQQTTSTVPTTAQPACKIVFRAKSKVDVFRDPCEPITFVDSVQSLSILQRANPRSCNVWFQLATQIVYSCPCGPGTAFDIVQGGCINEFHANCTCPDGRRPMSAESENPMNNNLGLIIGIVIGVIIIAILTFVIVLLAMRKQRQRSRPMTPAIQQDPRPFEYDYISDYKVIPENSVYDNAPPCEYTQYDNSGNIDREAIRAREKNATIKSDISTISDNVPPPSLPGGHPSTRSCFSEKAQEEVQEEEQDQVQEEPIYIDAV